jgi:FG-GAP repeat protein
MRIQSTARLFLALTLAGALLTFNSSLVRNASARSNTSLSWSFAANFEGQDQVHRPCKEDKEKEEKDGGNDIEKYKDKDVDSCLPEGSSNGISKGDFNGDGFADLAVGVPNEDVNGFQDAGAFNVIYGTADGLHANVAILNQFWTENDIIQGFGITAGTNNQFGAALAAGNFNGDGFSDLAIGIPLNEIGLSNGVVINDAGLIVVLYGSQNGLTSAGSQFFLQGTEGPGGLGDLPEAGDRFGSVLSWGDFDGDGFGDLAVGIPDENDESDTGTDFDAGAVQIIYGTGTGLTTARNQLFTQRSPGILDVTESGDKFGSALAGGDFNGDGQTDLAVGVPLENVGSISDAGAVHIIFGSTPGEITAAGGLTSTDNQFWTQDSVQGFIEIQEQAEPFDKFGSSLAAGDFDGDLRTFASSASKTSDLAIGVPLEDVQLSANAVIVDAGAVHVLYGSQPGDGITGDGLTTAFNQFWTQDSPGVPDTAEEGDKFGSSLAAGDFNKRSQSPTQSDLAIGVPFEDVGSIADAGAVNVIYGSGNRLVANDSANPPQFFHQDSAGIADLAEAGDRFGSSLTAWNFGKDVEDQSFGDRRTTDLAIGVPFEDFSGRADVGAVVVLYGDNPEALPLNGGRLSAEGNQFWNQNSSGIIDSCETGDHFGATMY